VTAGTANPQAWELADLPLHRLVSLGRRTTRERCANSLRVAVLGDAATQHYCQALGATLKLRGWWPEIYEAEFDSIQQELLNPQSETYRSNPEFVVLFTTTQALWHRYASVSEKASFADEVCNDLFSHWDLLQSRTSATVIQHNFVLPLNRPYGNYTSLHADTFAASIGRINGRILEEAALRGVKIVDTEFQASYHGKRQWLDERLWCQARQALAPTFIPSMVKNVSDTMLAERGVGIKCVVVDLDNTMWGGILAEDGRDLIEIGQTEVGLVFHRFQLALLELKARGVLLAICSKNDQANVEDVLDNHPDMLLRRSDFVAVVANFGDKVSNIMAIREKLNIGFDSFAFLDDTAFERELVRQALPQVQVPELPADPAGFIADLSRWNLFEGRSATSEDLARLAYYQANEQRETIRAKYGGLDDFVADLKMQADIQPFNSFAIPRVHQLVQRSNQFNLTTIRYSEDELVGYATDRDASAFCIRLSDRLGDNGIIAAIIVRKVGDDAVVDTWIMSCRVLGRRVEELTLQLIIDRARALGCSRIVGQYVPTSKNGLVEDLYGRLGFASLQEDNNGKQLFALPIDRYEPRTLPIEIIEHELVEQA
jgi:FkbH-like protein